MRPVDLITPDLTIPAAADLRTPAATELSDHINQQLHHQQLGLQSPTGFVPVPVSLTPWQLSATQFAEAQRLAQLLGQLQAAVAARPHWLLALLAGLQPSDTVPGQIWRTLRSIYPEQPGQQPAAGAQVQRNLMLNRHDFLLDQQHQWRWVESNPIAAGMGPLNSRYLALLQAQDEKSARYAPNDAISQQAQFLAQAAKASAAAEQHTRPPLLLIVVEQDEDNIYDQQLLCAQVSRLGVPVIRLTIEALLNCQFTDHQSTAQQLTARQRVHWQGQIVDVIYWRTAYNPSAALNDDYWQLRARLEQAAVLQCPNLAGQLTGSKWFQHQFSRLLLDSPQTVADSFAITDADLHSLQQAVLPSYAVAQLSTPQATQLINNGYWYKTQQEGGGNVARGPAALQQLAHAEAADLLMAPIDACIRRQALTCLRQGTTQIAHANISELGIFSLGDTASYGGYLCRTKPAQNNEGGVHRGGAVLDTIQFSDD